MPISGAILVKISHAPGSASGDWFAKTLRHKDGDRTTVFLFQRADSKPSLGRKISDFFNGIRPASDKANKHLQHVLSQLPSNEQSGTPHQTDIHMRHLKEITPHLQLPGKTRSREGVNPSAERQIRGVMSYVLSETKEALDEKEQIASKINSLYEKLSSKNLPDKNKLISAINYAIDIESTIARPKSTADIAKLSEHLNQLLLVVNFQEDSPLLEQLQTMYTRLQVCSN